MEPDDIKLRPLELDDYKIALNWSKDIHFCIANGWPQNRSDEELSLWWSNCVNNKKEDFVRMGIEFNDKLIGYADLACIKGNTAEVGIAIGESKLWGKGIGYHSLLCMVNYA
ncbi:GNAT family N-acetyltransferase [Neobacillus sp. D3-1R]|uniref:GNAT family N-acetyltransferase n=1 Tax=Neobacillus sp. D3-1R TaxID=3445778 RepID=UPI003F9EFFE9